MKGDNDARIRGQGVGNWLQHAYMRMARNNGSPYMAKLTRRGFIAATAAAGTVRLMPNLTTKLPARRILTLVYDKGMGMMRAVERVVH